MNSAARAEYSSTAPLCGRLEEVVGVRQDDDLHRLVAAGLERGAQGRLVLLGHDLHVLCPEEPQDRHADPLPVGSRVVGQQRAEPVGQVAFPESVHLTVDEGLAIAQDGAVVRRRLVPELAEVAAQAGLQRCFIAVTGRRHGHLGRGAGTRDLLVRDPLGTLDGLVLGHDEAHPIHGRRRHARRRRRCPGSAAAS